MVRSGAFQLPSSMLCLQPHSGVRALFLIEDIVGGDFD
jgi:hypothetical protein